MIVVSGIRVPLESGPGAAFAAARKKLGLADSQVASAGLYRVSYDARHGNLSLVCSVSLSLYEAGKEPEYVRRFDFVRIAPDEVFSPPVGETPLVNRPVVVGLGPAGLFAAFALARAGFAPVVLERGPDVEKRAAAVARFNQTGALEPNANIQFGEGGAGTFSDGKLTSRGNDPLTGFVLNTFCDFGAPREILHDAKPHIGTDVLRGVVKNLREQIIALGGSVHFETPLTGLRSLNSRLLAAQTPSGEFPADVLILAAGHSARDVFSLAAETGLRLSPKAFSVGLRIEHRQSDIDAALWGKHAGNPLLPPGQYALSTKIGGRAVYTFCMCPGGGVVAAASEVGGVVVNGMSNHARSGDNANAAVCVAVSPADFGGGVFDGIAFQRKIEQAAFTMGGGQYRAPASDVGSFMASRAGLRIGSVQPSYPRGVTPGDLGELLGDAISDSIRGGLAAFSNKIRCFANGDAIVTGPETRTSSPVRIERDAQTRVSCGLAGLYPCGEGAGYAGGIMSAAIDGLKTAETIIRNYKPGYR